MIEVLLVNEKDETIGKEEKLEAHRKSLLHRAFSVFLVNENKEILIQKRAEGKYHSGGVWSNSCCSHQYHGETIYESAGRCILDELGMELSLDESSLKEAGTFLYFADLGEMKEHEIDHVLIVKAPEEPVFRLNPEEVTEVRWMSVSDIDRELEAGENYSAWFSEAYVIARKKIME